MINYEVKKHNDLRRGDVVTAVNLVSGNVTELAEICYISEVNTGIDVRVNGQFKTLYPHSDYVFISKAERKPDNWPPLEHDVWSAVSTQKHFWHYLNCKLVSTSSTRSFSSLEEFLRINPKAKLEFRLSK